jgi:hypothetical protein
MIQRSPAATTTAGAAGVELAKSTTGTNARLRRTMMTGKVEISREIAKEAFSMMKWSASEKIRGMADVIRKALDATPVVKHQEPIGYFAGVNLKAIRERHEQYGQAEFRAQTVKYGEFSSPLYAEPPEMAELREELERIRSLNHNQILAESVGRHLLNSGAKNYLGEVFTITLDDGSDQFEVVVTTQKVNGKSPHDLLMASERRNAELTKVLKALPEEFKELSGSECTAGVTACIEHVEQCIFEAFKPTESGESS